MVSRTKELRYRVEARQKELEQRLAEAKADAQRIKNDEVERIEGRLGELQDVLKNGWDELTNQAINRLNEWLKESEGRRA